MVARVPWCFGNMVSWAWLERGASTIVGPRRRRTGACSARTQARTPPWAEARAWHVPDCASRVYGFLVAGVAFSVDGLVPRAPAFVPWAWLGKANDARALHVLAALLGLRILVVCAVFWVDGLVPVGPPRVAVRCRHRAACVAVE